MKRPSSATVYVEFIAAAAILVLGALLFVRSSRASPETDSRTPTPPLVTRRVSEARWIVSRKDKDRYMADVAQVTRQVTLKPISGDTEGSVRYLQIVELLEGGPVYAAGFRKDDQILEINGAPIETIGRAINLIHEIQSCSRLIVLLKRGDKTLHYEFDFQ